MSGVVAARPQAEAEKLRVGRQRFAQVCSSVLADVARRRQSVLQSRRRSFVRRDFRTGEEQGETRQTGAQR